MEKLMKSRKHTQSTFVVKQYDSSDKRYCSKNALELFLCVLLTADIKIQRYPT